MEDKIVTHIIREMWEVLFDNEEYDIDDLTDKLNEKIKKIKNENKK